MDIAGLPISPSRSAALCPIQSPRATTSLSCSVRISTRATQGRKSGEVVSPWPTGVVGARAPSPLGPQDRAQPYNELKFLQLDC